MAETQNNLFSNKHKNYIKSALRRKEISKIESDMLNSELIKEINVKQNYEHRGTGKFIPEGTIARLKAIPYYVPENIVNEGDIISYHNGYYERGTRLIEILIREGNVKTGNVEINSENFEIELRKIAINDGMNPEIDFKNLPDIIKFNTIYASGFIEGQLLAPSKKSRR